METWQQGRVPPHFWDDLCNRRRYLEWLGKRLGYKRNEDWYQVHGNDFRDNYGAGLLASHYRNSYQDALAELVPGYDWLPWRFRTTPDGFWEQSENRIRYMQWLGRRLGYRSLEDWYALSHTHLVENHGFGVLRYAGTVAGAVKILFPREDIHEWRFSAVPRNFWRSPGNRKRYFDWLGKQLGYTHLEDWYQVTADDFQKHHGGGLLYLHFRNSPSLAVKRTFRHHTWLDWRFTCAPQGFWKNRRNCRRYLKWLGNELGFKTPDDWYQIKVEDFKQHFGLGLLQTYDSSPTKLLRSLLPECPLRVSRFHTRPQAFWKSKKNQKAFLDALFVKLNYKSMDDWYRLTFEQVSRNGGYGLLRHYNGSHSAALIANYPNHEWLEWRFVSVPKGFWDKPANRRRYFVWLGEQLGIRTLDDWYRVNSQMIEHNYGRGLKQLVFGGSPSRAIMETFPQHKWIPWKFEVVPNGFWHDKKNRVAYLRWLGKRLGIARKTDWYEITKKRFVENYGGGFLDFYRNSCALAVTECFDTMHWDIELFATLRTNQKRIYRIIKRVWHDAVWEHKHPDMRFVKSGRAMELDIWIPSTKVAVEYQGEQHFFPVPGWGGKKAFAEIKRRDAEKKKRCKQLGIRLVEVPYTWDGDSKSLMGLLATKTE